MTIAQYIFTETRNDVTWTSADHQAVKLGGELASVATADEDAFFKSVFAAHDDIFTYDPRDNAGQGPWIGLVQAPGSVEPGGGWGWTDGSAYDETFWHASQPDNFLDDMYGFYWKTPDGTVGWADQIDDPVEQGYGAIKSFATEFDVEQVNLTGSRFDDLVYGASHYNVIHGGAGNDTIYGGGGKDLIYGDEGRDTYAFQGSAATANKVVIADLQDRERVDLSALDANLNKAGDQKFKLVEALTGKAGELAVYFDGHDTHIVGDVDGADEKHFAEFDITLVGDGVGLVGLVL